MRQIRIVESDRSSSGRPGILPAFPVMSSPATAAQQQHGAGHGAEQHELLAQRIEASEIEIDGAHHIGDVAQRRSEGVDGLPVRRDGAAERREGLRDAEQPGKIARAARTSRMSRVRGLTSVPW